MGTVDRRVIVNAVGKSPMEAGPPAARRCKSCTHWVPLAYREGAGGCANPKLSPSEHATGDELGYPSNPMLRLVSGPETGPDFGCVHYHAAKYLAASPTKGKVFP